MTSAEGALVAAGATTEDAREGCAALARACAAIRGKQTRRNALPGDGPVLKEIESEKPFLELSVDARLEIAAAAATFMPGRFGAPFTTTREWLVSDATQARLNALDPETLQLLRDAAAGGIEAKRTHPSDAISQATGHTYRATKRGQPMRFAEFDFGCACYVVYFEATKSLPGRVWDPIAGRPIGKFHAFMVAAFAQFGFGRESAGFDRRVRDVIAWMAPEGEPFKSEFEHVHRFWIDPTPD
ncbi:hypothetical protein [Dokdonella immobilis]|uniref:Uncharacterized protein n=1 Tax=Dokdonella immobilis TaxID=578942 RepID=A0A1I4ZV59_9GAMM|nr:hypothetical protein [Dokdonella immobilis]SFN53900.1 hypothetical protein SAMN05216289_12916 [Dokdonella immobilis]